MATYQLRLEAFADPTRRRILESLAGGPRTVGTIAQGVPVSRPAVSQHLKVLKDVGLVRMRSEGTRNFYELDRRGIDTIRKYFERFWTDALTNFARVAEGKDKP